ncbi:MAG: YeeE/YedE thiosulfate transporter family protein [Saprospiraceae bacterium]|nr:YeeE/YedE thiosulfate transporter family protein [Saprospiraceae bacterium]
MNITQFLSQPWPWYIAGPLIGLMIPLLLILGNKAFGVSSSLRHICAAALPANLAFFKYNWKKELWNLFFVAGLVIGGFIAAYLLRNPEPMQLNPALVAELGTYGIVPTSSFLPESVFNWSALFTLKGFISMVVGGFLVGFGTRYAGGCTSGHSIMGLSTLQWPSLVATICFMLGGFLVANFVIPQLLK